ncbi:hypothetical protein OOK58_42215 [Streptomyces sp. NBC_01728]|uniref:hypothetical protein n=1 Tax=unclassified Streptomyces TaxID=2593676 RepID=UPI0022592675|nr:MULTISPECIES: hypothetical protein [unclassified Streptomyces]MCX4458531.1 hypothetical protein [Streptomyces sp. NBC_01719]MCX4497888.1 hypothetical protein [Streptomyces sp. NBC_01728]
MATTDSPPESGYQPSDRLKERLAAWQASVEWHPKDGEPEPADRIPSVAEARDALEAGIGQELAEDLQLSLTTLAEHVPWTAENLRLLMAKRGGYPPRERHRKNEGDPRVYQPSERLRDLLAAYNLSLDTERKRLDELEECIADELRANSDLTNPELAKHLPWEQEQVRLIARARNVPRRRKRGSEHKLIEDKGKPKSVVVPYDWYVQQPGADPSIAKR